jgi:predicted ATPase/transcriptional regulator with XRE-family HTH domain
MDPMSHASASFAHVLRQLRTAASLSQEELAERARLSLRGVSDLERGLRRTPHLSTVRMLADALELSPPDRQALLTAARPGRVPERVDDAPGHYTPLPVPLTALLGRERELTTLVSLVQASDVRLVTLTGAGGTGKTRLALEVAAHLRGALHDGVVFVDLTPLADPNLVIPAIASALGVRERLGQSHLDALSSVVAPMHMLLILDNFERVVAAAPHVVTLLATCSQVTILTTSREALGVRGERAFPLLPLQLPPADQLLPVEELAGIPAIALFVERAAANHPNFALTPDDAAFVAAICRRLDGLPLAIELAAARISVLPPSALLARLEPRLPVLTGGSRDLPPRQRTMRDAIAWSYDLLESEEQGLFRCLAIFVGGATFESIEAVAHPMGDVDLLKDLAALIDKSLLRQDVGTDGEPRFSMLETIREYALTQLRAVGEAETVQDRHAAHYLALAESIEHRRLAAPGDGPWLDRLEVELGNLRAILAWVTAPDTANGRLRVGLWLSALLWRFWEASGRLTEGRDWLEHALTLGGDVPIEVRISAMNQAAALAHAQGDLPRAEVLASQALAAGQANGPDTLVDRTLQILGAVALDRGEHARAEAFLDEALAVSSGLGFERSIAHSLADLGRVVLATGDLTREVPLLEEALSRYRELAHTPGCADVLSSLGRAAEARGDYDQAVALHEDALAHWREVRDRWGVPRALTSLARVDAARGDIVSAAQQYAESLELLVEQGQLATAANVLDGLAGMAASTRRPVIAARLFGAAQAVRGAIGATVQPIDQEDRDRCLARLHSMLGTATLATERASGQAMPLNVAVVEALALAAEIATDDRLDRPDRV